MSLASSRQARAQPELTAPPPSFDLQVPAYIENYDKFITKGVKEVYVVAINDTFVLQAWSKKLAEQGTKVR